MPLTNTPETLNILNPDFRMPEHCGGDRWSILHGDSLQILRQFEPNSFDAIITDPPYASGGSSQTTKNRSTSEKYSSMSKEKALPDFDSDQMDQLSWMFWTAAWLQDARRIAKPGAPVCLFIDWRQLPAMTLALQWAGWTWRGVAVWDKVASRPQKGRFRQQSEYIVWGSNGKMPLERNVGCLPGVFRYPNPQNRIHVTEKPLQLMAYTSVIPVRRLDWAVKYVMNKEKTTAVSLQDALDYAANRDKTEQSCFESSYACTLETAFADMRQTKERWHKSGGVQGYHLVQSFAAGEVTPELAHQIAKELADRVLGGRYEYVIGTHLNTGHIHSHIVWNSVSCVDGKKYRSNYKSYVTEIRAVSDELCRKYKLSIIDTENSNHVAKPYAEWLAEKNNQPTWRTAIRQDVDEAIQQSLTWRQFLTVLDRKGYEVRMGRKYPILRPPGKERFVRFKTLGKRYTPEAIQTRILYPQSYHPYVENPPTIQHGRLHSGKKPHRKLTGLRALYYRYLYELGALPRKPRRPSYAVRQDAYKLDQRIREMEFLSKHNIDTLAQLETYRQAKLGEIIQLTAERKSLYKTNPDSPRIQQVNTALKQLRQEERLCRKIAEHSLEVQQHLTEARRDRAEQQKQEQERARDRRPNIDLTL